MSNYQVVSATSTQLITPLFTNAYLNRPKQALRILVLRTAFSSASRFSSSCVAMRSSHPNSLIMRMTFITAYGRIP